MFKSKKEKEKLKIDDSFKMQEARESLRHQSDSNNNNNNLFYLDSMSSSLFLSSSLETICVQSIYV
ncbi:hypothetical protein DERP_005292 [Dermatophagoides pteronyssinus]|uniref:Uncharacterized protein n=1 Tax=Dermatophagoides pteronyssinus TaxID=6956 RepID=A0ABQ8JM81_DERPT|nr:hypothetical protein DERP_005292 [Dermatophagoides pteronyssinus]